MNPLVRQHWRVARLPGARARDYVPHQIQLLFFLSRQSTHSATRSARRARSASAPTGRNQRAIRPAPPRAMATKRPRVPADRLTPHTMALNPIGHDTSAYRVFHRLHANPVAIIVAASQVHSNGASACAAAKALTFTASSISRSVTRHHS